MQQTQTTVTFPSQTVRGKKFKLAEIKSTDQANTSANTAIANIRILIF